MGDSCKWKATAGPAQIHDHQGASMTSGERTFMRSASAGTAIRTQVSAVMAARRPASLPVSCTRADAAAEACTLWGCSTSVFAARVAARLAFRTRASCAACPALHQHSRTFHRPVIRAQQRDEILGGES